MIEAIRKAAIPLSLLTSQNNRAVCDAIGDAKVVLIGEASHGTMEFYQRRIEITKSLINARKISLLLVEGDFPPFCHLNKYVNSSSCAFSIEAAMAGLKDRFPIWMWYNEPMKDFLQWLKKANMDREPADRVSIIGMDIYSLFRSADEVIRYLDQHDPDLAMIARKQYASLGTFAPDAAGYAEAVASRRFSSQEKKVVQMLAEINTREIEYTNSLGNGAEYFNVQQNAKVVVAAEEYYRNSFMGGGATWNIRDKAMFETLLSSIAHHSKPHPHDTKNTPRNCRAVVWAHNSHIGDSHHTSQHHETNIGKLCRDHFGNDAYLIGFSTHTGSVRAASRWGHPDSIMELNDSITNSLGSILNRVGNALNSPDFGLIFQSKMGLSPDQIAAKTALSIPLQQRFIGVQYVKSTERESHYIKCCVSLQYDLLIHFDKTHALKKLPDSPAVTVRPGTIDYAKWDHMELYFEED